MIVLFKFMNSNWLKIIQHVIKSVDLVLHPHGIDPTFLKLDSWSPGAGLYSYYIHQGNKSDKSTVKSFLFREKVITTLRIYQN